MEVVATMITGAAAVTGATATLVLSVFGVCKPIPATVAGVTRILVPAVIGLFEVGVPPAAETVNKQDELLILYMHMHVYWHYLHIMNEA